MLSMSVILIHKIKIRQLPWTENESRKLIFDSSLVYRTLVRWFLITIFQTSPSVSVSNRLFLTFLVDIILNT
jgi:hypothetical protein